MADNKKHTCHDIEKMISEYLEGTLNDDEFLDFYAHIKGCGNCKEELTIQYLVKAGLEENDGSSESELLPGLDRKMDEHFNHIIFKRSLRFGISLIAIGLLVFIFLMLI